MQPLTDAVFEKQDLFRSFKIVIFMSITMQAGPPGIYRQFPLSLQVNTKYKNYSLKM